jgi:hypothetical protein
MYKEKSTLNVTYSHSVILSHSWLKLPPVSSCLCKDGNSEQRTHTASRLGPRATPVDYAQTVKDYSQQTVQTTLFPGSNYLPLANFLNRPYEHRASTPSVSRNTSHIEDPFVFATLHEFGNEKHHKVTHFTSGKAGLERYAQYNTTSSECGRLLFLRGFPSPDWLNLIGSRHRVDPEFFRRHLDFLQPSGSFDLPATPILARNFLSLPVITIGKRRTGYTGINLSVGEDRERSANEMSTYRQELSAVNTVGQSIVRKFFIHDATHFAIEQDVSVYVRGKGKSWDGASIILTCNLISWADYTLAIIWLDCGRDLTTSNIGPWLDPPGTLRTMQISFVPVFQHYAKMALRTPGPKLPAKLEPHHSGRTSNSFQSISVMHEFYGKSSDHGTMQSDVFYALSELFSFSCAASNQAMNLIEKKIEECTVLSQSDRALGLSTLQTSKTHLDAHLQQLHFLHAFVKNRKNAKWPAASEPEQVEIVNDAAHDLLETYDYLIYRAIALSRRCSDSTASLMNQSMLDESRNAISQARIVGRLTLLAFFFIPLSFSTSFFGMNVKELSGKDGPRIGIWLWFVVTGPIFLVSLVVCFWSKIESPIRRWVECLRVKHRQSKS